jgi:hypothetical protein
VNKWGRIIQLFSHQGELLCLTEFGCILRYDIATGTFFLVTEA